MMTATKHNAFHLVMMIFLLLQCCFAWIPSTPLFSKQVSVVLSGAKSNHNSVEAQAITTCVPEEVNNKDLLKSVNYFISRKCNYACKFCFHTAKSSHHLALAQATIGLELLRDAGTEKINFAGGEPFLHPTLLGELCKLCSSNLGMAVSIISNGSLITAEWMEMYGKYVDVLGISVDSFDDATNAAIGRGDPREQQQQQQQQQQQHGRISSSLHNTTATDNIKSNNNNINNQHVDRVLKVRELCRKHDIIFKLNTVVCSLNWDEDMVAQVKRLEPQRWKVFQVLLLDNENMGGEHTVETLSSTVSSGANVTTGTKTKTTVRALRDARPLVVTDDQFDAFVQRHAPYIPQLIPEPNNVMQNSYLLLDENMCFLDCSQGSKVPGESILKVGVHKALQQAGFDHSMFQERGGEYEWKRERK